MSERIIAPVESPYRVPFDRSFRIDDAATRPPKRERGEKKRHQEALAECIRKTNELQQRLYASDRHALLLVFQAMDAAGKDGTIRATLTGLNPSGIEVHSFKKPSEEELDHDFLWRMYPRLPERGRLAVFNRSHYEEVLVVRVHRELLARQRLPGASDPEKIFEERYESIRQFERHLARNGTAIVKFFLHVSREEQRKRFIDRIDDPAAHWKFNPGDIDERREWPEYMRAYEVALNETSRKHAPWYVIPADDKAFMRRTVAEIVLRTLEAIDPAFPTLGDEDRARMIELRAELGAEGEEKVPAL